MHSLHFRGARIQKARIRSREGDIMGICYNHRIKWTERMNRELYFMYLQSKPTEKGYQKRLKVLWDESFPEYAHLNSKHVPKQVRNIKRKNLLNEINRQLLEIRFHTPEMDIGENETTIKQPKQDDHSEPQAIPMTVNDKEPTDKLLSSNKPSNTINATNGTLK